MALCRRISYLYALALLTVYALFLPLGGYERMMEGKYRAFLLLSLGYVLAMTALGAWKAIRWREPMCLAALAYLALTALIAALSPYGTAVLLGGTRRDGLLTAALYAAVFLLLARHLRPDRWLLYAAAVSAALCGLLVLVQLTGRNPLWLYPTGLNYFDGDIAYSGFYAGAAGNIDFTTFLLALCAAAMAAALVRGWSGWLLVPLALTVWTLWQLRVAAALLGLAVTAVLGLPLLFPRQRRAMWALTLLLTAAAFALIWFFPGDGGTLSELHRLLHGDVDLTFGSSRLLIWRSLLPLIAERPLLGGGCGTLYLRDVPRRRDHLLRRHERAQRIPRRPRRSGRVGAACVPCAACARALARVPPCGKRPLRGRGHGAALLRGDGVFLRRLLHHGCLPLAAARGARTEGKIESEGKVLDLPLTFFTF